MKVRTSVLRGFALLALSSLTFAACDEKTVVPEPIPPAITVTVAPQAMTLQVGQSNSFVAVVNNSTNQAVTWSSTNTAVATVNASGVVTAVSPGSATIVATSAADANARSAGSVTVTPGPAITLTLVPQSASVQVNGTVDLVGIVGGSTNQTVNYVSSTPSVATVHPTTGRVTGVSVGTAVITARTAADPNVFQLSTITVTAGTPGEQVQISVTPSQATIGINGTQQFVGNVTGSTNTTVIWRSATESVATIDAQGIATGRAAGTTVITAIAAADTTRRVTATLTVAATTQPSISIQSVTTALGAAVAPNTPTGGTLTVRVNVSAGSETNISRVQVRLNDIVACEQTFSPPLAPTQGVAEIVCPIATTAVNADGTPIWMNGNYTLTAVAMSGDAVVATANYGTLILANLNVLAATMRTSGNTAIGGATSVAPGLLWQEGDVIVEVRPTMFAGGAVGSVRVCLNANGAAVPTANSVAVPQGTICRTASSSLENMFTVTFPKALAHTTHPTTGLGVNNVEAQNFSAGVTSITAAGVTGPGTNTNAINLDNLAPVVTSLIINPNAYVNADFMFGGAAGCTTAPYTGTCLAAIDLGSDAHTTVFSVLNASGAVVTGGADVTSPAGLEETTTSTQLILRAVVTDALGNTRTVYGSAAGAPSTTLAGASRFGIDLTAPTITVASGPPHNSSNPNTNTYDFTFVDAGIGPSGFSATPLQIRVEQFTPTATGGVLRTCIHPTAGTQLAGTGNGCTTNGGFVTVADGNPDVILPFAAVDAYFQVTARVRDFAGNMSADSVRVTLDDQVAPVVGNIVAPTSLTGGQQATFSAQMQDNVELGDQLGYVGFAALNTFIVTGRDVLAQYGFDVLTSQANATHTIDQFIRSIETTAGGVPTGTIAMATDMNLAVRDMAGMQTGGACPVAGVVGVQEPAGPFLPGSCRTVQTSIINAVNLGMGGAAETSWTAANRPFGPVTATNPNGGGTSFQQTSNANPVCSNIPVGNHAGCNVVTATTKTLTATATGPAQTFANPFQRVNFYYTDTNNRAHLIGTGSVTVTDNTVTNIRTWTYTTSWNPGAMGVWANPGYAVWALGVDAQGRGLATNVVMVPVTSD
jgi:hypothetical protein